MYGKFYFVLESLYGCKDTAVLNVFLTNVFFFIEETMD